MRLNGSSFKDSHLIGPSTISALEEPRLVCWLVMGLVALEPVVIKRSSCLWKLRSDWNQSDWTLPSCILPNCLWTSYIQMRCFLWSKHPLAPEQCQSCMVDKQRRAQCILVLPLPLSTLPLHGTHPLCQDPQFHQSLTPLYMALPAGKSFSLVYKEIQADASNTWHRQDRHRGHRRFKHKKAWPRIRTHSTKLHSFRGLCMLRGSRPLTISSRTTPKLKTSLFAERCCVE